MRNLKRVLSLALACVMVIGMMVMTTGAADLKDYDEITNVEAVDVMVALGVLEGDDLGNFNPEKILTREQAAKIICFMLMGPANAEKLVGTSAFTDVTADRWSAPYIAYCASLDIISGYDGKFDPTGELTGVAFAKMLLIALGYDAQIEGYVNNDNWATNIGSDAIDAGINVRGVALDAAVTRENAAQMALNTLQANMVKYTNKGTTIKIEGVDVVVGASAAEPLTSGTLASSDNISAAQYNGTDIIQFGEKYFTKLNKTAVIPTGTGLGYNGYNWTLTGQPAPISEFVKTDKVLLTVTNGDKISELSTNTHAKYAVDLHTTVDYYVNGVKVTATANASSQTISVNGTNGYFANVTNILNESTAADGTGAAEYSNSSAIVELIDTFPYDGKVDRVVILEKDVKVATDDAKVTTTGAVSNVTLPGVLGGATNVKNVVGYEGVQENDVVMYYVLGTKTYIEECEAVTATLTKIDKNARPTDYYLNGVAHKWEANYNGASVAAASVTGIPAVFYLNTEGEVVYTTGVASIPKYAYVIGIDGEATMALTGKVSIDVEALVMLADGTLATYPVKVDKTVGGGTAYGDSSASDIYKTGTTTIVDMGAADTGSDNATSLTEINTALATNLTAMDGKIFAYAIKDGKIVLNTVAAVTSTATGADTSATNTIVATDTKQPFTTLSGDALLNSKTIFVMYNAQKNTASSVTGAANLNGSIATGADAVLTWDGTNHVASVVFTESFTPTAAGVESVVYIDKDQYTEEIKGNDTIYTYSGIALDGTTVEVFAKNTALSADGLYPYYTDGEVKNGEAKTYTTSASNPYANGTAGMVGEDLITVDAGTTYYNVTEDTVVVYVDRTKDKVDTNSVVLALEVVKGALTMNVSTIYVVG